MRAKAVVVKVGAVAAIALAGLTTFDSAESFADGPLYITPHRMEQFEDASQRWSLLENQFGNIGGMLVGTAGAIGGACAYLIPGPVYEAGQFLGGKLGELWNLPSQRSLERQFGVMPDPKFGPVMIIGGDEAAWGGRLR